MKLNVCMLLGYRYNPRMQIPPDVGIPSYITKFNHRVTWILSSEEMVKILETTFDEVHIFVIPYKYRKKFLKVIDKILYLFRRFFFMYKNFKVENYNLIFARSSVFDGLLAICLKKKYNIPFVFEMENPIEQNWVTFNFDSKHGYIWNLIEKVDSIIMMYILHEADLILPVGRFMMDYLSKKGIEESKMMNLPQGMNLNRFSSMNENEIKKKYGLENSKVVIYVGSMSKLRHLDVIIHAFSKINERTGIKLLMVGDGDDKKHLEELAKDLGIENEVIFTGWIYDFDVPNFIAVADVGVSPILPLEIYKVSCPIKMIEYMAMGKPIVANEEIPEQKVVLQETGCGILVKFDADSFAIAITKLLDNLELAKEMGAKGKDWVIKNRSYEILARQLENRYYDLITKRTHLGKT